MNKSLDCAKWMGVAAAIMLSPTTLAFGVPFAYGIGSDIIGGHGPDRIALLLEAAAAILLWRRLSRQRAGYAAKSMT